jgi:molybdenum cofactor cytidylyltransferase
LSKPKIHGLILAAGLSGRMISFKPLADYKGKSFIINIILKLEVICDQIFIVTGQKANVLENSVINDLAKFHHTELLKKIKFVYNESYEKGMFTSLKKGILAAKNCEWILYHFVDQPGLTKDFYMNFINHIDVNYNWIQPSYKNKNGHPILIKSDLFDLIISSPPDSSLREINKDSVVKRKFWECDHKEIFQDIDTDKDLENI